MELRDVAERGKAPRGSIYHHFPGGKRQLAVEAAELEGTEIRAAIERSLAERGLARDADACSARCSAAASRTTPSGSAARSPPPRSPAPRTPRSPPPPPPPSRAGKRRSPPRCARKASRAEDADAFAGLVVSTIEGALLRARAAGDHAPLDSAVAGLHRALEALLLALAEHAPFRRDASRAASSMHPRFGRGGLWRRDRETRPGDAGPDLPRRPRRWPRSGSPPAAAAPTNRARRELTFFVAIQPGGTIEEVSETLLGRIERQVHDRRRNSSPPTPASSANSWSAGSAPRTPRSTSSAWT